MGYFLLILELTQSSTGTVVTLRTLITQMSRSQISGEASPAPGLRWWRASAPGARPGCGGWPPARGWAPGASRDSRPLSWRPSLRTLRTWSWPASCWSGSAHAWRWPGPLRGRWCEYCQSHPTGSWRPWPGCGPRRAYPCNAWWLEMTLTCYNRASYFL